MTQRIPSIGMISALSLLAFGGVAMAQSSGGNLGTQNGTVPSASVSGTKAAATPEGGKMMKKDSMMKSGSMMKKDSMKKNSMMKKKTMAK